MLKGEKMLIQLGYEKSKEEHYNTIRFICNSIYVEFYKSSKSVGVYHESEEYGRVLIKMPAKVIQAINQIMIDWGWIKDETLTNATETIGYAEQSGLASAT